MIKVSESYLGRQREWVKLFLPLNRVKKGK